MICRPGAIAYGRADMKPSTPQRALLRGSVLLLAAGLTWLAAGNSYGVTGASNPPVEATDPWTANDLIDPAALAKTLASPAGEKPTVLCVGVVRLFRGAHIVGAQFAGPGSTATGLAALEKAVHDFPRDRQLVIYCGCCPWNHCPNIRPAYALLRKLGFEHVRVLAIPENFHDDWVVPGFPVESGKKAL